MFDWQSLLDELPALLEGLFLSLTIIAWGICLSLMLGGLLAYLNAVSGRSLKKALAAYIIIFKHVPVLVVIYFFYKALPGLGVILPPIVCGLIGLCLQASAYTAEVIKGALNSLAKEQWEASLSLGLSPSQGFLKVILPQMWATLLPPLASVVVNIVKNSSLLAFISVAEFFYVIYKGGVTFFHYIEFFAVGVAFYLVLNYFITWVFAQLETLMVPKALSLQKIKPILAPVIIKTNPVETKF